MTENLYERRKQWRLLWLSSLSEIADIEMQKATWLNINPITWNPHYTFLEFIISYIESIEITFGVFEDRADYISQASPVLTYHVSNGLITNDELEAVGNLHAMICAYRPPNDDYYDHEGIIDDCNWQAVVAAAATARSRLMSLILDSSELHTLAQPSIHALQAARQKLPKKR
ncbi:MULTISPECIES: hypothetical protein [unclassified Aureimonas]|uniref:hypothetical protein n=1 Tax=unclassified Aureimonas TaxID=2615206 RepID=UPI0012E3D4B8|nr:MULTISPECIES: hypothetical protein [unclassified Aureimonas]